MYLVDTNVLLRGCDKNHALYSTLDPVLRDLRTNGHDLMATSQNFVEFWNVATRPSHRNGLGFTIEQATQFLVKAERLFPRLEDHSTVYELWRQLVMTYKVSGVQVHDARLVASMKFHGIRNILTLNGEDFRRYEPEGVVIVDPLSIGNGG